MRIPTRVCQLRRENSDFASLLLVCVAQERKLEAYSISFGQSLLYNNIFPKHRERLSKRMSELVSTVAKQVCLLGIAVGHLQACFTADKALRIEPANRPVITVAAGAPDQTQSLRHCGGLRG